MMLHNATCSIAYSKAVSRSLKVTSPCMLKLIAT